MVARIPRMKREAQKWEGGKEEEEGRRKGWEAGGWGWEGVERCRKICFAETERSSTRECADRAACLAAERVFSLRPPRQCRRFAHRRGRPCLHPATHTHTKHTHFFSRRHTKPIISSSSFSSSAFSPHAYFYAIRSTISVLPLLSAFFLAQSIKWLAECLRSNRKASEASQEIVRG